MPTQKPWKAPYLGAAYYPEDWPLEQIDQDIALMKEAGMNVMRIGEFAWSSMEPEEGKYDLGWLHLTVDKLAAAGIATIMCTPSATPPAWLSEHYPEILYVGYDTRPITHGGRRHACPNSPVYRDHCALIVTRMAEEFGANDNIIGWQIDNEVYPYGPSRSCCCPVCVKKFQSFMQKRYGTIENLNNAWCTNLWSQTYSSFEQLPIPRADILHHPSLLSAWDEFTSQSYIEFVEHQAEILHRLTNHPIGTDMMFFGGIDHYAMNRKLDIAQYNHYHRKETLYEAGFWFDYFRTIKETPFWNTETSTCWGGGVAPAGYEEEGFCRVNSWMPIAMGGELNLYWLWRTHWAGQELMHGSVISSCGRPMHIFGEVQEIAKGFEASSDFITGTRPVKSELAIHFSNLAYITFKNQPMIYGFNYNKSIRQDIYKPIIQKQFRPDVIDPNVDLADYKLIFTPFLPALDEGGLRERLKTWIENGGTWIVGPLSDVRTTDGTKFTSSPFGCLEEWSGVYCRYQLPGDPRDFALTWADGTESKGSLWYDGFEPKTAETLATYTEGHNKGLAAVTSNKMGKGRVIVLGTLPLADDLKWLMVSAAAQAGILPVAEASENLLVIPRKGETGEGIIVMEYENRPASFVLPCEAVDLLTGRKHSGTVDIPPYSVMVFKY